MRRRNKGAEGGSRGRETQGLSRMGRKEKAGRKRKWGKKSWMKLARELLGEKSQYVQEGGEKRGI